ncbi:SGNH/GDSL hydrolase family protein [Mycoplasmopsis pulmonis]|uniref:SGNH/GDSL hydrolase family protein n=1 Tax=Mycoplasmopsis pulmonis TaxID=2107 RepID=UPI001004FF28|nr:SGNH/GDSL hydrolase family protein [Mycoplasmopsis pulmonis]VEU68078.1 Uncharacterised protein [Mycoplasmopsis pulmonis]
MKMKNKILIGLGLASWAGIITTSAILLPKIGKGKDVAVVDNKNKDSETSSGSVSDDFDKNTKHSPDDKKANQNKDKKSSQSRSSESDLENKNNSENNFDSGFIDNNSTLSNDKRLIKDKIRFVTFGDSIAAGFNAKMLDYVPGEYDPNTKQITGLSYSSYIADYINDLDPNKLESFKNFAFSGTTLKDWNDYFNNKDTIFFNSTKSEDLSQREDFLKRLTNSNLLLLNLGANDFMSLAFEKFKEKDVLSLLMKKDASTNDLIGVFLPILSSIRHEMGIRYKELISHIRKYNKNVTINLIGYPMPALKLFNMVNKLLGESVKIGNDTLLGFLLNFINSSIKDQVDLYENVNFVNAYDDPLWLKHKNDFTDVAFDIHPNEIGYKKMAQEIFLKLAIDISKYNNPSEINSSWNANYLSYDHGKFSRLFEFKNKKDSEIITTVLGVNNSALFSKNDKRIALYESKFNTDNYSEILFRYSDIFKTLSKSAVEFIINSSIFKTLDPEEDLKKFLFANNEANYQKLFEILTKSRFVHNIINRSIRDTLTLDLDNNGQAGIQEIELSHLMTIFKKEISNLDNYLGLLREFSSSSFYVDPETNLSFKDIIKKILKNFLQKSELKTTLISKFTGAFIQNKILSHNLSELVLRIVSGEKTFALIEKLIDDIFDNKAVYQKVEKIEDFLFAFVNTNEKAITDFVRFVLNELVAKPENFKALVSFGISQFLNSSNEVISTQTSQAFYEVSKTLVNIVDTEELLEKVLKNFIEEIKSSAQLKLSNPKEFNLIEKLQKSIISTFGFTNDLGWSFLKQVVKSKSLSSVEQRDKFTSSLKEVVSFVFKSENVKNKLISSAGTYLSNIELFKENSDVFKGIFSHILNFEKTPELLNKIIDYVINSWESIDQYNDAFEFVLNFLKTNSSWFKTYVKDIFSSVVNSEIQYANILTSKLNKLASQAGFELTNSSVESIKNIFTNTLKIIADSNTIDALVDTFVNSKTLLEIDKKNFIASLKNIQIFALSDDNFFSVFKALISSNKLKDKAFVNQYKQDITNVLKELLFEEKFFNLIYSFMMPKTSELFENNPEALNKTTTILRNALKKNLDPDFINKMMDIIFDNLDKYQKLENYGQVLGLILKDNSDAIATKVQAIFKDVVNEANFQDVLKVLLVSQTKKFMGFELNADETNKISTDLTKILKQVFESNNFAKSLALATKDSLVIDGVQANKKIFDFTRFLNTFLLSEKDEKTKENYQMVKSILNTKLIDISQNSESIKNLLKTFTKSALSRDELYEKTIKVFLSKEKLASAYTPVYEFVKFVLKNEKTTNFSDLLIDSLFKDFSQYQQANSFEELIYLVLRNNKETVVNYLKELSFEIKSSNIIQRLLGQTINALVTPNGEKIFSDTELQSLSTLINESLDLFGKTNIISNLYDLVLSALSINQESSSVLTKVENITHKALDQQNSYFAVIKTLLSVKEGDVDKSDEFKAIIKKFLNLFAKNDYLLTKFISPIVDKTIDFDSATKSSIVKLIKNVLSDEQNLKFSAQIIDTIFANKNKYLAYENLNDFLIDALVDNKENIINLSSNTLGKIKTDDEFKNIIKSFITKNLMTSDSSITEEEINTIVKSAHELISIVDSSNFLNQLLKDFFALLEKNKKDSKSTSLEFSTFMKKSISEFLDAENNYLALFKKVLSSNLLSTQSDQSSFTKSISSILRVFLRKEKALELMLKKQFRNFELHDIKVDDAINLIKFIFRDNQVIDFIETIINRVVSQKEEYSKLNSYQEILYKFLSSNKNETLNFFKKQIGEIKNSKLINPLAKSFIESELKKSKITLQNDEIDSIVNFVNESLVVLEKTDLIDKLYDLVVSSFNAKVSDKTKVEIFNFSSLLKPIMDQKDNYFSLVKTLATINWKLMESQNTDALKNALGQMLLRVFKNTDLLNKFLDPVLQNINFIDQDQKDSKTKNENLRNASKQILVFVLQNEDTLEFFKSLVNNIISNNQNYKNANNYLDLIVSFIEKNKNLVTQYFKKIAPKIASDSMLKTFVNGFALNLLQEQNLELSKDELSLVSNITSGAIDALSTSNIVEKILEVFLAEVKKQNPQSKTNDLFASIQEILKSKFDFSQNGLFEVLSIILKSNILDSKSINNKEYIQKVKTLFEKLLKNTSVQNFVKDKFIENISKSIPIEQNNKQSLSKIVALIASDPQTTNLVNKVIDDIFKNHKNYASKANLNEILAEFLTTHKNQLLAYLKSIINKLNVKVSELHDFSVNVLLSQLKSKMNIEFNNKEKEQLKSILKTSIHLIINSDIPQLVLNNLIEELKNKKALSRSVSMQKIITRNLNFDKGFFEIFKIVLNSVKQKDNNFRQEVINQIKNGLSIVLNKDTLINAIFTNFDLKIPNDLKQNSFNLLKEISNDVHFHRVVEAILEVVFSNQIHYHNGKIYESAQRKSEIKNWEDLIRVVLEKSDNVANNKVEDALYDLIYKLLLKSNSLKNILVSQLLPMFKSAKFDIKTKHHEIILRFVQGLGRFAHEQGMLKNIFKKSLDKFKNTNFSKVDFNKLTIEIMNIIKSNFMDVKTNTLYVSNIWKTKDLLDKYFRTYRDATKDFVNFFNMLFEASSLPNKTWHQYQNGIYKMLTNIIYPNEANAGGAQGSSSSLKVDGWDIFKNLIHLVNTYKELMSVFSYHLGKGYIDTIWQTKNFKDNPYYKALFRITTIILWITYQNVDGFIWWNATNRTIEGFTYAGLEDGWNKAKNEKRGIVNNIRKFTGHYPEDKVVLNGSNLVQTIFGNRSNGTTRYNYYDDQLLAYIWWNSSKDRFTNHPNRIILLEALRNGWIQKTWKRR